MDKNKQFKAIQDSLNSILEELKAIRILCTPKTEQQSQAEEDELVDEAYKIVLKSGKISTASLQRRLSIGYGRAAKILDILEERGLIGSFYGERYRKVLIKK